MANDNQGSRTFLAIVLGGIVLALVIAAYFMYGHKGDTGVKVEQPVTEQPAETPTAPPAAETPAAPPAAETPAEPPAAPEPSAPETPAPEEAPAPQNP
jgi:outer membrane biosynthesis protein TonB